MARNTQLLELDLRSGIVSNESPYAIGQRLRAAQNVVWDYRYPRALVTGETGPWLTRQPLTFPLSALTTFTGAKSFRDIAFSSNGSITDEGVLLIGANSSDQYSVWNSDGVALTFAVGVGRFTIPSSAKRFGCSVQWEVPGTDPDGGAPISEGITVFSHPNGTKVYYLLDGDGEILSLTDDVTGCPAGASALAVHLDRLWLLTGNSLVYTDPFDCATIRADSEIIVRPDGRCLVPGQLGAIDASGVPHLVIGSPSSVQILDGDPQLGGGLQANLRLLLDGVGMGSAHCAAVTPYGVFFLGTDGDLWHIPLGMQKAVPVGGPIRDFLGANPVSGVVDSGGNALGSVVWFNPYLYLYPGGESAYAFVAEPTFDGIAKFWGPVTLSTDLTSGTRVAVVRAPTPGVYFPHAPSNTNTPSVHSIDVVPASSQARFLRFDQQTTEAVNVNRQAVLTTGLINVPGHRIQIARIILEVSQIPQISAANVAWTIGVTDEHGTSVTANREEAAPAGGVYNPDAITTHHFSVPAMPASRGMSLSILNTKGADLAVHRCLVEVHTSPAVR